MRFNKEAIYETLRKNKSRGENFIKGLPKYYQQAKHFANQVDKYANIAQDVHSSISPNIDEYGGQDLNNKIRKGFNSYRNIKKKVQEEHGKFEGLANNVQKSLSRNNINM